MKGGMDLVYILMDYFDGFGLWILFIKGVYELRVNNII